MMNSQQLLSSMLDGAWMAHSRKGIDVVQCSASELLAGWQWTWIDFSAAGVCNL